MPTNIVSEPIINSPYEEPGQHWKIQEHEPPEKIPERRLPTYMYLPRSAQASGKDEREAGYVIRLDLVVQIRKQLAAWRPLALKGEGGVSRVTMELLNYWRRDGRKEPLFFAQLEAAETIIFLTEARGDFLQGINIPKDQPGAEKRKEGYKELTRRCCRMATGAGKTTVMAMLAAWSILNKVNSRNDKRFSDAVLVVCPNVTIRDRLAELDPQRGEASLYRTRDLVPLAMMPQLAKGRLLTTNWHLFEPRTPNAGSKVTKTGRHLKIRETVFIGDKTTTARGKRYLTEADLLRQNAQGLLKILKKIEDASGTLKKAEIESQKYIETDAALVRRVLERTLGSRSNILVFNDEAHHAYRLRPTEGASDGNDNDINDDDEVSDYYYQEATTWVDGLDKIHKQRGINFCVDLSATPYFLGRAGNDTGRIFPWTVSNFDLQDAIEAGLVKIPQIAKRDSTGEPLPGYFNIWKWILPLLTPRERGGKKTGARPEAILKYAHTPIAMMGGMWRARFEKLAQSDDPRPPVLIIVCKTKKLADVVYEWLADDQPPTHIIPHARLPELVNTPDKKNTICVYSDMQADMDSGNAKNDEARWMRHTLDTIGRQDWPRDRQQRPQYPAGFEELAEKLGRDKHPPGRDVRCIVSVGMLTEGWDCKTVTHIIGLRPFMSQLLCEQVIGRGLRRTSYTPRENGLMDEEIATVLGVPLTAFTVKEKTGGNKEDSELHHIHSLPQRADLAISFPRVDGYQQALRIRLACDMARVPPLIVDPADIPPVVETSAALSGDEGYLSLLTPGTTRKLSLEEYRSKMRVQKELFAITQELARLRASNDNCEVPVNIIFQQLFRIVREYFDEKVSAIPPAEKRDAFIAPHYSKIIERLHHHIKPDETAGETPELPRYERMRGNGSTADVDFYTKRKPYPVIKSHINAVVPASGLERKTAYRLDQHQDVQAFAKNEGLGFGIPYLHNEQMHDYIPDFLIRLRHDGEEDRILILETKGFNDPLKEVKEAAAKRWAAAVNADGRHGRWHYCMISKAEAVDDAIKQARETLP